MTIASRISIFSGSAIKANNASPEAARSAGKVAAVTTTPRSAVCSISLKLEGGSAMRDLFNFALDNHRQHRVSDHPVADLAVSFLETVKRDHRLSHGSVAASAADVVIEFFHNFAGAFDIADIANGDDYPIIDET